MAVPGSLTVHINIKTLLIVLLLTVTPLLIDMFWVLDQSRSELTTLHGDYFETVANNAAGEVARFVEERVVDARLLAAQEPIRQLTEASPRAARPSGSDPAQFAETDQKWETPEVAPIVASVVGNPASIYLREQLTLRSRLRRVLVTDSQGRAVAASHKPIRYFFGGERWWFFAYGDGLTGRTQVSEVAWDPVTLAYCVAITVPVRNTEETEVAGLLRVFVDISEFHPIIAKLRLGATGAARLANREGTVISAGEPESAMKEKAEEMEVVSPLLEDRLRGATTVRLRGGGRALVGYADVGLARKYPELDWVVILSQDFAEMSAAIRTVNFRALASGFLAILILGAVAVYFTTHRPQKFEQMDELLKE